MAASRAARKREGNRRIPLQAKASGLRETEPISQRPRGSQEARRSKSRFEQKKDIALGCKESLLRESKTIVGQSNPQTRPRLMFWATVRTHQPEKEHESANMRCPTQLETST